VRRYRLYPNKEQQQYFAKCFGCVRFVYNRMLAEKKEAYEKTGKNPQITPAKYKEEFPWLKEVDSLALSNAQLHLETAFKNFSRNPTFGFPKFKAKHHSADSYTSNVTNGNIRIEGKYLRLPKIGTVRMKIHRGIEERWKLKSVTVKQEPSGKYYAALLYETKRIENQERKGEIENVLGIDFAMHGLAVFSDGTKADYPMFYRKAEKKLAREQRRLSKCEKGSHNYYKQKKKVALAYEKVRHQREDYQHKLSRILVDRYDAIAVEDLNMKSMSQSLNFGKSTMDNAYGAFREKLSYKLKQQGKAFVKIDRFYPSSKTCSCCGAKKEDLELSDRVFICTCGNIMDRDVNAAINIRQEGKRMLISA